MLDNDLEEGFVSLQERAIYNLSYLLLGSQALFCPSNYDGSKEPADLAWVANKCAMLMYMTSGKKSFEKKCRHNFGQLHRWLRVWSSGRPLKSPSGLMVGFDEVDRVIGLSVIGGEEVFCRFEEKESLY